MARTHKVIDSPIGELTLVGESGMLVGVYFPGHWTKPDRSTFGELTDTGFDEVEHQLTDYFSGERTTFDLAISTTGEPFQQSVWELIGAIPYGETRTYGELARELGSPSLARAVGVGVGSNPLSVIVPCHRIVGKDGSLTGYAGGLERKRFLLELEGASVVREYEMARI